MNIISLVGALPWLPQLITKLLPLIMTEVSRLGNKSMSGDRKFDIVVKSVVAILDETADDLPGWRDLTETQRDRILAAMVEIAVTAYWVANPPISKPKKRKPKIRLPKVKFKRDKK